MLETGSAAGITDAHRGMSASDIKESFLDNLFGQLGRSLVAATINDQYLALALTVRERLFETSVRTLEAYRSADTRAAAYLSAEYLPGPHLGNVMLSLGMTEPARAAIEELGLDFDRIINQEQEPGLGNGGLGRLASCYMDSLATLGYSAIGYGIRYEFGIFDQEIRDGWQVEVTDHWLRWGNPWEIVRPEIAYEVHYGGHTENYHDELGHERVRWVPDRIVRGVAYDTPILGYHVQTCNRMRLWRAEAVESFDFKTFEHGDYFGAVAQKMYSETITKVLYPNDEVISGKFLRLEQQFFFVTCSLQDMIRIHTTINHQPLTTFHEKWTVQLNDTHPSVGVAELMRLLVDEHNVGWDDAWDVTRHTFNYTNHTLLPEALEKWPIEIFGQLLPRHLEIVYEINRRFLDEVKATYPDDPGKVTRMSLIDETGGRFVRMAYLATVGSQKVNGVAALHSELLKETILRDFYELWPEKFVNVTNGVTPRRFMALANPPLAALITSRIGADWLYDLYHLRKLEPFAGDAEFGRAWREVKHVAKVQLAALLKERTGVSVDPATLFDVQAKRLHEYKRQHLSALYVLALYLRLKHDPTATEAPRTFVFGGKAASGYVMAKLIIKFINAIGALVNGDPVTRDRLRVTFFPDFNVKNAQAIYPAADLSEQISLAGMEASGTGNMKFALNGALTIGTLDGANVEIREEVGAESFFLFGLTVPQVAELKPHYRPRDFYDDNATLREVLDFISAGALANGNTALFAPLVDNLLDHDPYLVLADFESYLEAQQRVGERWHDQTAWTRESILNVARMGKFSSDRSVREYARTIWNLKPVEAGPTAAV